jgi:hypothetical protein
VQSLLRGLLLGSHNIIKLPSSGLPELIEWISQLPSDLANLVETHQKITTSQWDEANAVIAIGSEATITSIQQKIRPHQIFIPHGHKVSIGIVTADFAKAAPLAARDASLFNQRGCLSPHAIYVKEIHGDEARAFAKLLATAMENFAQTTPPLPLDLSEAGAVRNLRETTRFRAANTTDCQLWESPNNLNWTVIYDTSPHLQLSCLNRCIYVRPLPKDLSLSTLGPEAQHLSTIALHPFTQDDAESVATLPAHRICPLGQSQSPSLLWHHDGFAPLASLVTWKDIG